VTTHRSATRYARCPAHWSCPRTSAQAVIQVPDLDSGYLLYPCVSYGFTHVQVTSSRGKHGTVASQRGFWASDKIEMTNLSGRVVVTPDALSRTRQSFLVACDSLLYP
jgi:hypothetical protein